MTTISTTSGYATFINVFTCEPENQERLVETLMQETTEVVSGLPGFVSANLHRSLDGRTVVNYAQWTDLGAFRALMAGPQGNELRQRVHGLATGVEINLYEVDRVLGNGGGQS